MSSRHLRREKNLKINCLISRPSAINSQMRDASDMDLLREYARQNSEAAFAELVRRHIALVYSAALRQVGVAAQAEEITQAVFVILARKAAGLRPDTVLDAWLYETTRLTTLSFLRGERRRQFREHEAYMQSTLPESTDASVWNQLAPLLDEAMFRLGKKDREAVVLRYFKEKNLAEVAAAMKTTEAAAQSRVHRAVEKLRKFFHKRGVDSTASAIAENISAHSIQAAPVALAKSVTALAIAKGATASVSTLTLIKGALKIMAWTKMKAAIVVAAGVLLASGTGTVLIHKQIQARQFTPAQAPWSDAGAATPKSALQSLAWAATHGKIQRADQLMQWEEVNTNYGNPSIEHQIVLQAILPGGINTVESFKILSITPAGSDAVIVKFKKTFKQGNLAPMTLTAKLRRVGSEWHVVGKIQYYPDGGVTTFLPFSTSF